MIRELENGNGDVTMNVYLKCGVKHSGVDFTSYVNDESKFLSFWAKWNKNILVVVPMNEVSYFEYKYEEE